MASMVLGDEEHMLTFPKEQIPSSVLRKKDFFADSIESMIGCHLKRLFKMPTALKSVRKSLHCATLHAG